MMQPISNEWIDKLAALRAENNELRQDRFTLRLIWLTYGIFGGLLLAAVMAWIWRA